MDRAKTIKGLLGIEGDDHETTISFHLASAIQEVLNYCNIEELPKELEYMVINMVIKHMRATVEGMEQVKSQTNGSASVTFNTDPITATLLTGYKSQLNRFRRLDWS